MPVAADVVAGNVNDDVDNDDNDDNDDDDDDAEDSFNVVGLSGSIYGWDTCLSSLF